MLGSVAPAPSRLDIGTTENITLNADGGNDTVDASALAVSLVRLMVDGGLDNDAITGGQGDDVLPGGDGNDSITGGRGGDVLVGRGGLDALDGGAGDNILVQ